MLLSVRRKVYCEIDVMYYKIGCNSQGNKLMKPFLVVFKCVKSTSASFWLGRANEH